MNTSLAAAIASASLTPILPEGAPETVDEQKRMLIKACPTDSTGNLFLEIPAPHHDDIAAKPIPRRGQRQSYIRRKGRK